MSLKKTLLILLTILSVIVCFGRAGGGGGSHPSSHPSESSVHEPSVSHESSSASEYHYTPVHVGSGDGWSSTSTPLTPQEAEDDLRLMIGIFGFMLFAMFALLISDLNNNG